MTTPIPAVEWQPIASAPHDREILVYTKPWGAIIASYSSEFSEWLSRMQVPVSIRDEGEMPTHWVELPAPPGERHDGAAAGYGDGSPDLAAT